MPHARREVTCSPDDGRFGQNHRSRGGLKTLAFQEYFVRLRADVPVSALSFDGAEGARPAEEIAPALANADLAAIIMCPSNPLSQQVGFRSLPCPVCGRPCWIAAVPIIAVSPIVGGAALKGPAAKIMQELGVEPSVVSIARHYRGFATGLVIDHVDADYAPAVEGGRNACVRHAVSDAVGGGPPPARTRDPPLRS